MKTILNHNFSNTRKTIYRAYLRISATSCAFGLLASCQSFQSKPLNLPAHAAKWRGLSASDEKVQAFAKRLAQSSPTVQPFNPANGVSISEGEVIALVYNPDLRVARLKAGVAKASAKYAGLWDDPELSIDVLKITKGVPNPWVVGSAISLTVPLSGRLQVEKGRANAAMHVELDRVAEAEWRVISALRSAWISWSAQRLRLEQSKKMVASLDNIIKSTSELVKQGEIPRTEAALFTIERTSQRAEIDRLKGEVAAEEQEIRSLLGLSPSAAIRLVPALATASVQPSEKRLAANNPTLGRLRREYEVSERTLLREIRKQYPDLQIGPQAEKDQGQSSIGFIGAIPLPIFNSNKGGIARARANREVAQAAFETEYERKVGRLAALRARLNASYAQQKSIGKTLVPLVDRQVVDAQRLVKLGEGGSLVLLESLTRAHEAKQKIINIQLKTSQVKNDIRFLLGPTSRK
ncbi:MAG: TolC family protein [Verrucomicrobiae bacterium]|nr:TolC family protein [Verrucomicrobiae bacterium]NNJ42684.1 TolC family protein [Akkermansiaceae bacterium]